jgi:hypothetical protein
MGEQLAGFYGPMLALRAQTLSQSELHQRISRKAGVAWQEMTKRAYEGNDESGRIDRMERLTQQRWPSFERLAEYGNRQLVEEIIPSYRKMAEFFASKMHLAEPSTISYFPALLEFVEVWTRWLDGSLPVEVLGQLGHSESTLFPFAPRALREATLVGLVVPIPYKGPGISFRSESSRRSQEDRPRQIAFDTEF